MKIRVTITVERTVHVVADLISWPAVHEQDYDGYDYEPDMVVPIVLKFNVEIPDNLTYPEALVRLRTRANELFIKYNAKRTEIDLGELDRVFKDKANPK